MLGVERFLQLGELVALEQEYLIHDLLEADAYARQDLEEFDDAFRARLEIDPRGLQAEALQDLALHVQGLVAAQEPEGGRSPHGTRHGTHQHALASILESPDVVGEHFGPDGGVEPEGDGQGVLAVGRAGHEGAPMLIGQPVR